MASHEPPRALDSQQHLERLAAARHNAAARDKQAAGARYLPEQQDYSSGNGLAEGGLHSKVYNHCPRSQVEATRVDRIVEIVERFAGQSCALCGFMH